MFLFVAAGACMAKTPHAPLSPKLLAAKTVYIENHGSAKQADKVHKELEQWGRFEVMDSSNKADIVLVISSTAGEHSSGKTRTYDPKANGGYGGWKYGKVDSDSPSSAHLEIRDTKSGDTLYSDDRQESSTHKLIQELRKRIEEQEKATK